MSESNLPRIPKWPFYAGDSVLCIIAGLIYLQGQSPRSLWELSFIVICVVSGALLGVVPHILDFRALVALSEVSELNSVVGQVQEIEKLANQIHGATGQWQSVQESADKTTTAANQIAERIVAEARSFQDFMQRANETEKVTLRLEVEKLRRSEGDWLQVLVRILDHVYALNQGALRSGQPNLIEQMGHFQDACRDVVRRVGLNVFIAKEEEPFDAQRHQIIDGESQPEVGGIVNDTVAVGYTFQGRLLRPALVRLRASETGAAPESESVSERTAL